MFNTKTTDHIEKIIREKRQSEEKPSHFDIEIQDAGKFLTMTYSETIPTDFKQMAVNF